MDKIKIVKYIVYFVMMICIAIRSDIKNERAKDILLSFILYILAGFATIVD